MRSDIFLPQRCWQTAYSHRITWLKCSSKCFIVDMKSKSKTKLLLKINQLYSVAASFPPPPHCFCHLSLHPLLPLSSLTLTVSVISLISHHEKKLFNYSLIQLPSPFMCIYQTKRETDKQSKGRGMKVTFSATSCVHICGASPALHYATLQELFSKITAPVFVGIYKTICFFLGSFPPWLSFLSSHFCVWL